MATVDSLRTDYDRGRNIFRRPSVKILLDEIGRLNGQVLYWKAATEAARDDIKLLSVANEQMADAWMRTETIQTDRSLRPFLADTVKRAAELEAENARLQTALDEMGQARIRYTRG